MSQKYCFLVSTKNIIFIVGLSGVGKTSVSNELSILTGYFVLNFGEILRSYAKELGVSHISKLKGSKKEISLELGKRLIGKLQKINFRNGIIIDGVSSPNIIHEVQKFFPSAKLNVFYLTAPRRTRLRRVQLRERLSTYDAKQKINTSNQLKKTFGLFEVSKMAKKARGVIRSSKKTINTARKISRRI